MLSLKLEMKRRHTVRPRYLPNTRDSVSITWQLTSNAPVMPRKVIPKITRCALLIAFQPHNAAAQRPHAHGHVNRHFIVYGPLQLLVSRWHTP